MSDPVDTAGIVVAAGRGERFGGSVPKALTVLGGRPLVAHAVAALAAAGLSPIVVAAPLEHAEQMRSLLDEQADRASADVVVIVGGERRQDSVAAALGRIGTAARWVLVHDAARALAPPELALAVLDALRAGSPAIIPALPVVDTIKSMTNGVVRATIDRSSLVAVQTPQGFDVEVLREAYWAALGTDAASDDASLVERCGVAVRVITGAPEAMKITRPLDLAIAELLLAGGRPSTPVGEPR